MAIESFTPTQKRARKIWPAFVLETVGLKQRDVRRL
jgi:hypothetical protein